MASLISYRELQPFFFSLERNVPSADTASLDFDNDLALFGIGPGKIKLLQLAHLLSEGITGEAGWMRHR